MNNETFNKTSNFLKYQFQSNYLNKIIEKTSIRWVTIDTLLNCIDNTQETPLSLRGVFKNTICTDETRWVSIMSSHYIHENEPDFMYSLPSM